ncbi:hypothetical protein ACKAMS_22735 [Rhodococcus sp. 5A-K4]|uniref:phage tail termination protein n=1 Tax=Rhodococcus sp. 5A-K4 TaxID=3384442 RepID=UPI0038D387B8
MSVNDFPSIDDLPDWPDLEDLMCTYFARFGTALTQRPNPDEFNERLTAGEVFIEIARAGGGAPDGRLDLAPIVVAVTSTKRSTSWQVMGQIRKAVQVANNGVTIDGVLIHSITETGELSMIPQLGVDPRTVELTFVTIAPMPRTR